jgi:hypothetical protein
MPEHHGEFVLVPAEAGVVEVDHREPIAVDQDVVPNCRSAWIRL